MNEWIYNKPVFECDKYNVIMLEYSPWSGHRDFIYDFVLFFRPKIIVELGTYIGSSAFAIAQSIKDNNLDSIIYCVDTWSGDIFTENDYKEIEIYKNFKYIRDFLYEKEIVILKEKFDNAVKKFDINIIDMLHIDGSHEYNDVKNDFLTWKDKVSKNGVVFFHDISDDDLMGSKMGSHVFWNELKLKYKYTFEFPYSFGLGVLFFSEDAYLQFKKNINKNYYINSYFKKSNGFKDKIRKNYFEKISLKKYIEELKEEKSLLEETIRDYKNTVEAKDNYIEELREEKSLLEETIRDYKNRVEAKDNYIEELREEKSLLEETIRDYKNTVEAKDNYIEELREEKSLLEETIRDYKNTVEAKDNYIEELREEKSLLEETIRDYKNTVEAKDNYISNLNEIKERMQIDLLKTKDLEDRIMKMEKIFNKNIILKKIRKYYDKKYK